MRARAIFQAAISYGYPVAFWRLPGVRQIAAAIQLDEASDPAKLDLSAPEPGFIMGPFVNPGGAQNFSFKADVFLEGVAEDLTWKDTGRSDSARQKDFVERVDEFSRGETPNRPGWHEGFAPCSTRSQKEHYLDLVAKGVQAAREGVFDKVVLSRTKELSLNRGFEPVRNFAALCGAYPHAFVVLASHPRVGTWMAATPEVLLSLNAGGVLSTMALAGTKPAEVASGGCSPWTPKEDEEHAFVSAYIAECLRKAGVGGFSTKGPYTVSAGNLIHLRTDFTAEIGSGRALETLGSLVDVMHPTPAVCGMPTAAARDFILANEHYDRMFFTGYWGPVHVGGEVHLFVNLRCLRLSLDQAILYAGCGITSGSDPEGEWVESENKCDTLLRVIEGVLPEHEA